MASSSGPQSFHLVYLRSGPVLIFRGEQFAADSFPIRFGDDFMTSLGPWDAEGMMAFLIDDWDDGLAAVDRFRVFAGGTSEFTDLTRDPRDPELGDRRAAGAFRIGDWLLGSPAVGGGFGLVFEAFAPDGAPLVAKVAKASHSPGEATQIFVEGAHGRRPVRVPADAYIQNTGDVRWSPCPLGRDALVAILLAEADTLARDGGRLLPRSFGVWDSNETGEPVLVMERLVGRPPAHTLEIRNLLAAVADAVERGTFNAHGDLKFEHVFVGPDGELRVCDPAPRLPNHGARGYTAAYNPRGFDGPAADIAASASMIRFAEGDFTHSARVWVAAILDNEAIPHWIGNYREALLHLDTELALSK